MKVKPARNVLLVGNRTYDLPKPVKGATTTVDVEDETILLTGDETRWHITGKRPRVVEPKKPRRKRAA